MHVQVNSTTITTITTTTTTTTTTTLTVQVEEQNDERDEDLAKWEIVVLSCILAVTICGNVLVLLSLYLRKYRGRRKFTRMYFFIMHLSIADLLTGLLDVLPQLAWDITFRFHGGPLLCKVVKFFQPLGPYSSSYVLTAAAIDRYHAICHPLSYCSTTSRRSRIMVYCAWIFALTLCLPQLFVFSYREIAPGIWDCWATFHMEYGERAYVTWYSALVFLLPFVVLVYTYVGICVGVWRSNKMSGAIGDRKHGKSFDRNRHPFISKAMINTVRQTISVITLYVLTSSPFIGCELWMTWASKESTSSFADGPAFPILALLNSLTSCVNPWIYLSFNRELRVALTDLFCHRYEYSQHRIGRDNSNTTSTRVSLISRLSRYAGSVIFR